MKCVERLVSGKGQHMVSMAVGWGKGFRQGRDALANAFLAQRLDFPARIKLEG